MIGIYKFTNKITGESYIGQSRNIHKRYIQHKNRYMVSLHNDKPQEDTYFHQMLRHYGFDNFNFEILEECLVDELNEKEIYYIEKYKTLYPNGYNKDKGGNSPHPNRINSYETVDEIIKLLKTSNLTNIEIGKLFGVSDQTISDINNGRTWTQDELTYPIRNTYAISNKKNKTNNANCKICGFPISCNSKSGLCRKCYNKSIKRSDKIPNKKELYNLLLEKPFTFVGKMYGVSDNAVRKWCDKYNIPRHSSYYRKIA